MQKHYVSREPVIFWSMTNERYRTVSSGEHVLFVLFFGNGLKPLATLTFEIILDFVYSCRGPS